MPLFVYGPTGGGKSGVLSDVLASLDVPRAIVDCVACATPRALYETCLNQLHDHRPCEANNYSSWCSCENPAQFVQGVRDVAQERGRVCLVFDRAERLQQQEKLLSTLLTLPTLVSLGQSEVSSYVLPVFVAEALWAGGGSKFHMLTQFRPILCIGFGGYDKPQLSTILKRDAPRLVALGPGRGPGLGLVVVLRLGCRSLLTAVVLALAPLLPQALLHLHAGVRLHELEHGHGPHPLVFLEAPVLRRHLELLQQEAVARLARCVARLAHCAPHHGHVEHALLVPNSQHGQRERETGRGIQGGQATVQGGQAMTALRRRAALWSRVPPRVELCTHRGTRPGGTGPWAVAWPDRATAVLASRRGQAGSASTRHTAERGPCVRGDSGSP